MTYNMEGIIANEKKYLDVLDKMHSINFDELATPNMF